MQQNSVQYSTFKLIGYARVSTGLQNLDLQTDALAQHGCTKISHDKMSGTKNIVPV